MRAEDRERVTGVHGPTNPNREPVAVAHVLEHPHPAARQYVVVALILAVITAIEVAVFYIQPLKVVIVPLLLGLSATKFTLVVLYYMHLKFDSSLFAKLFILGLAIATAILLALLALFAR